MAFFFCAFCIQFLGQAKCIQLPPIVGSDRSRLGRFIMPPTRSRSRTASKQKNASAAIPTPSNPETQPISGLARENPSKKTAQSRIPGEAPRPPFRSRVWHLVLLLFFLKWESWSWFSIKMGTRLAAVGHGSLFCAGRAEGTG